MRIAICGGGPGGLYFALLTKKRFPHYEVVVHEKNAPGTTYGWGIVFSRHARDFMRDADDESFEALDGEMVRWDELTVVHRGTPIMIDGCPFSGMSRARLLGVLSRCALRAGVNIHYGSRIAQLSDLGDADLYVAADGSRSALRSAVADQVNPSTTILTNKYAWYGTRHLFRTLTLTFRGNADGFFVGHCYPYSSEYSTFTVECDAETWRRVGFDAMTDAESRRYSAKVFEEDLQGQVLLSNNSRWLNFPILKTERLVAGNVVLLGDAARSVHYSIGSGTRTALDDAVCLFQAICIDRPLEESLAQFEQQRLAPCAKLMRIAEGSYSWYERFPSHMALGSWEFAYSYMTRGGLLDEAALKKRSPRFMQLYSSIQRQEL